MGQIPYPSLVYTYSLIVVSTSDPSIIVAGPNPTQKIIITITHECATVPTLVPDTTQSTIYTIGEPQKEINVATESPDLDCVQYLLKRASDNSIIDTNTDS